VKLIPINRLTEAQWLAYYQLRLELRFYAQANPPPPQFSAEAFRTRTLRTVIQLKGQEYVLFSTKEERPIGWIRFFCTADELKVAFDFHHAVLPAGFVHLIAKGIDHRFRTYHYPRLTSVMTQERHKTALRALLPSQELIYLDTELEPENIQHAVAAGYLAAFEQQNPAYRFEWCTNLPEAFHTDYIRLNAALQRDLPLAGERLESSIWTHESLKQLAAVNESSNQDIHVLFLLSPEGERVGLSEMTVHASTGKCAQGMTGVLAAHRGRGLAQALKAEMLRRMPELVPNMKVISTSTSVHNHPMRHINRALGFVERSESSNFTILPEDIARYMAAYAQGAQDRGNPTPTPEQD
jgi:RimJ/RimL family protein N-acetyltransferase